MSSSPAASSSAAAAKLPAGVTIGFIGAGAMASAIARGIGEAKLLPWNQIYMSDLHPEIASDLAAKGVHVSSRNSDVIRSSSVLVLATKPDAIVPVLQQDRAAIEQKKPLIVSIAAGVSLDTLQQALPPNSRVARVMPNTPALVAAGAAGIAFGEKAAGNQQDVDVVNTIFNSVGLGVRVAEKDLDAVTGVSGSGPAYVFLFIEALADGGVAAGLPRATALKLATQTVLGSAQLVAQSGKHPAQLKDQVASPGGTTIAGIHALEEGAFRATTINAVRAAARRAAEMGKPKSKL